MFAGIMNDENISAIFHQTGDFQRRELRADGKVLYAYGIDGLISGADASELVLKPISQQLRGATMEEMYHNALYGSVYNCVVAACTNLADVAQKLVNGFCIILFPDVGALSFEVKSGEKRNPGSPKVENTIKGPKDAFVETVRSNTGLVRRHLRTPMLRFYETQVGATSRTNVTVAWIEGITDPQLVKRMKTRLQQINTESFLTPAAVEESVTGSRATAFPLLQYTERTDRFCRGLIDGQIGLFVDGIPLGYLLPVDLGRFMDSQEDFAKDYVSASLLRVLRYAALVLSLLLPGVYIAMATFHQEMIPLPLLRAVIESKKSVPFSTAVEVIGLLIAFELLQESGVQLPQAIGQSVSIIGGIVIGTAAVEAKLISSAALIAVSAAGICGFVLPNRDFANAVRTWRLGIALVSALAGLFGAASGLILLLIHLSSLSSLGEPYLSPLVEGADTTILRKRLRFLDRKDIRK